MNYCPFCDEDLTMYCNFDSSSYDDDYVMDETMLEANFSGGIKRTRSQAGLEDNLSKPGPIKRQRIDSNDPMIICLD